MDLRRGHVGGCALLYAERVVGIAVRQRPHTGLGAAGRDVGALHIAGEARVSGLHIFRDRVQQLRAEPRLVSRADARWELRKRPRKRAVLRLRRGQGLGLAQHLFEQKPGRGSLVTDADVNCIGDLLKRARQGTEARDVVLVVLDRGKRRNRLDLRQVDLDAVELVDRHLPRLIQSLLLLLDEPARHQLSRQLLLLRKPIGRDGRKPLEVARSPGKRLIVGGG